LIVVSDTSPINNLAAINQLHLLHQLYGTVLIPEAVFRELTDPNFPVAGATEVQTFDWLQTLTVSDRTLVEALSNELDIGEAEAIALAVEIQANQVLIDERRGRLVATRLNLRYIGILGILVEAKSQGLIAEVKPLLDALVNEAGFWVAEPLYNSVLQLVDEIDSL
jgi:Predicted nucleic acid-binding protein, contains PIN domain